MLSKKEEELMLSKSVDIRPNVHLLIHGFVPVQPVGGAPVVCVLQPEVVRLQQVELLAHLLEQHLPASLRLQTNNWRTSIFHQFVLQFVISKCIL